MRMLAFAILGSVALFLLGTVFGIATCRADELPFTTSSQSVLVIDAETEEIIIEKKAEETRPIASITKLMTAIVILDAGLNLEEEIVISQEDAKATTIRGQNTGSNLPVGTRLTRAELLHLALMNSQNRAAYALARTYPGGADTFVAAMNNKAQVLGMFSTKYVDPTGLYNDNISTARDLAILVRHSSDYVLVRDFSTSSVFELTTYSKKKRPQKIGFSTTNSLVRSDKWHIDVQKTGYIKDAGRCLVLYTSIGARKVIVVLLNAISNEARAADANNIKYYVETGNIPVKEQIKREKLEKQKATKEKATKQKATKSRDRG